jgi:enoyl-CoA hydratase/carnithine racemase
MMAAIDSHLPRSLTMPSPPVSISTGASPQALLTALKEETHFEPHGDPAGNLTLGRGTIGGKPLRVALVESRIASGSLGVAECTRLEKFFRVVTLEKSPLILFLDSAGARVSEGLPALGAFRAMFGAALATATSGVPMVSILGNNCFGGASMLAHLARVRIFSPNTVLAMSGPSILAQAAGTSALDESFRAIANATIGAEARARAGERNRVCADVVALGELLRGALHEVATEEAGEIRHVMLHERLGKAREVFQGISLQRPDLDKLFPGGYRLNELHGVVTGDARREGIDHDVLGFIRGKPLGAVHALQLADLAWALARTSSRPVILLLDCDSHATRLEDEKLVLSDFLADLSLAFAASRERGLTTVVLRKAGGGVYVAFASPANKVELVHGGEIQLLPGSAIASILGENIATKPEFNDYLKAGVAEEELRLGLVPL